MRFAERTGLTSNRPARRYSVDGRLCSLQLPRPGECHRGRLLRRPGPAPRRRGAPSARMLPGRRARPKRVDQRPSRQRGRGSPHVRRASHRQTSARAIAGRAAGSKSGVGSGRAILPLPHQVDARARSGRPLDWATAIPRVGARAGLCRAREIHVRPAGRQAHGVEAQHRSLEAPGFISMGHHDPLDGFVTYTQLERTAVALLPVAEARLHGAIVDFAEMVDREPLATADPLGIGGLLVDACRLAQVGADGERIAPLLEASVAGLEAYVTEPDLRAPAHLRLAFRGSASRSASRLYRCSRPSRSPAGSALPVKRASRSWRNSSRSTPRSRLSGWNRITGKHPVGSSMPISTR